jgi:beta-lactamase regulating signal transducer with metallopeptidase domain
MFLDTMIRASIQDGLLVLALIIGLRFLVVAPKVRVWLWRAVYVKLAVSLLPFGSIPLKVLPQQPMIAQQTLHNSSEIVDNFQEPASAPTRNSLDPWLWAWSSGVVVAGLFALFRYHACREAVLQSEPTSNDEIATALLGLAGSVGKRKLPAVFISKELSTAVVVGSRTPTILLPQDLPDSEDLRLVLAHELAHVAHRDLEWNAFTSFVDCLFFFHPLVWLARRASLQAQEAAADAAAIRLTNASPKRYGEMLVRATILEPSPSFSAGLSVGAPTGRIRMRLEELRYVNARPTITKFVAATMLATFVISMAPAYELQAREAQTTLTAVSTANTHGTLLAAQAKPKAHRQAKRSTRNRKSLRLRHGYRSSVRPAYAAVPTIYVTRASLAPQIATVEASAPAAAVSIGTSTDPQGAEAPSAISVTTAPQPARASSSARISTRPTRVHGGRVTITRPPSASAVSAEPALAAGASTIEVAPAMAAPETGVTVSSEPIATTDASPATTMILAQGTARATGMPIRVVTVGKNGKTYVNTVRYSIKPARARSYRVTWSSKHSGVTLVQGAKGTGVGKGSGKGSGSGVGTSKGSGSSKGSGTGTAAGTSQGSGSAQGSGSSSGN